MASATWAAQEVVGVALSDRWLTARLVCSAELLTEYPGLVIGVAAVDG